MPSKLQAWCAGALEAALLLAVLTVPAFINYYGFSVFELPKAALLVSFGLLAAVFGLIALVEGRGAGLRTAWRQPLVLAALLGALAALVATLGSSQPRLSFLGSLERAMGLATGLATLALFLAAAWLAREPARRDRIATLLIAGSLPVAAYALSQALGLVAVQGTVESASRVFGSLANPIFLGAYLMLVLPLSLARLAQAVRAERGGVFAGYACVILVQLLALVFSGSRGPLLGLWVGGLVLVLAYALLRSWRGLAWGIVGLATAGLLFLLVFNLPVSPLAPLRELPVIGRFGRIADTSAGSEAARLRIWRSTNTLLAEEPERLLIGHGPETLKYALIPHAETYIAGRGQAGRLVDRAHNVLLDALAMTGLPGALALLLTFGAWLHGAATAAGLAPDRADRRRLAYALAGGTLLGALLWPLAPPYGAAATLLGMLGGLGLYLLGKLIRPRHPEPDAALEGSVPGATETPWLALALLAAGAAALVEAAFGIQTVVTQLVFWVMAGLLAGLAAGDRAATASLPAPAAPPRQRAARARAEPLPAEGRVLTLSWSAVGAALGLASGALLAVILYDLWLVGTPFLPDAGLVLALLLGAGAAAGLLATLDLGESGTAWLLAAGLTVLSFVLLRVLVLAMAQDASWLYAALLLWLVALVPLAGTALRGRAAAEAPAWIGPAGIAYPLLALPAGAAILALAIAPVRADIYFQSALANFDAALAGDDALRFADAETLFGRATALNPHEDSYLIAWGERFMRVGAQAADLSAAAQAFGRAQSLVQQAELLDPDMPYHTFNRGQLQLVFAQRLPPDSPQLPEVAGNAVVALQQVFDRVPYDPAVANQLALGKLLLGDVAGATQLLEYARDTLDDENGETLRLLGEAYRAAGRSEEARAALQAAIDRGQGLSAADRMASLLALGELARTAGDLPAAIGYYEDLLARGGGDWRVLFNLGLVYRDAGDLDRALAALSQTLSVAPQDETTLGQIQSALDTVSARKSGLPEAPAAP